MTELKSEIGTQEAGPLTPPKKRRGRAIALGLIILFSGFMLGAGFTVVFFKHVVDMIHTPGEAPKRITKRMQRKLGLTDEQAAKMRAILTERQKDLLAIFHEVQPRLQDQFKRTRDEVAAILNSEQAKQWLERFDHMWQKWHHITQPEREQPE